MAVYRAEELLILAKTYPLPSEKHRETTCVAAVNRQGALRRIFPIPFRFLQGDAKFDKWEWIRVQALKATGDNRPESYRVDTDTLKLLGQKIDTGKDRRWTERRQWIEPHIVSNFTALEERRQTTEETLGILRPTRLLGLDITPVPKKDRDWSEEELRKLTQERLFDDTDVKARQMLKKVPFDFHYRYECASARGTEANRHLITDWESSMLYWNCVHSHGERWEQPFRAKLETEFAQKHMMFVMGTMHRFPSQWLIVGLIYPPKPSPPTPEPATAADPELAEQLSLGL